MLTRVFFGLALVAVLSAGISCSTGLAADPPSFAPVDPPADDAKPDDDAKPAVPDPRRAKMVRDFSRRLGRLKPADTTRKSMDHFFVIGTAVLTPATGHADVCFQVQEGQLETAEFVVDYVLNANEQSVRKWHVFTRFADEQQAEQALLMLRSQYDQMVSYQAQLRQIYGARTMRRC